MQPRSYTSSCAKKKDFGLPRPPFSDAPPMDVLIVVYPVLAGARVCAFGLTPNKHKQRGQRA